MYDRPVIALLVIALAVAVVAFAINRPADEEVDKHKARAFEKELSDERHFMAKQHNQEFDHEAFLGKEEAKGFDQLTPEESKDRLGKIYDKIDTNHDSKVTKDELRDWIKYVQKKYIVSDTDRQWKEHEPDNEGRLEWDRYRQRTYGNVEDMESTQEDDEDDAYNYRDMVRRDQRRWAKSDADGDGRLSKDEFTDFLHPEEAEHMREIVIDETLEDIDKDKDGKISLEEYIADIDDDDDDVTWVESEHREFAERWDRDHDGLLDRDEVLAWILPEFFDNVDSETKHLVQESDVNQDGELTKEEVLAKYELFVGSQATDFGEALSRHDEF